MIRRTPLLTLLSVAACEVDLGDECDRLVITEVMSAGESWPLPQADHQMVDWIELRNDSDHPLNVRGFGVDGPGLGFIEGRRFPDHWDELGPGDLLLLVASTYDLYYGRPGPDDPLEFSLMLDFNNDGASVDLIGPPGTGAARCHHVALPDQHATFSWSYQDEGPESWCATVPTPGEANAECVCDQSLQGC